MDYQLVLAAQKFLKKTSRTLRTVEHANQHLSETVREGRDLLTRFNEPGIGDAARIASGTSEADGTAAFLETLNRILIVLGKLCAANDAGPEDKPTGVPSIVQKAA